jgi:CAAX protease family protein
MHEPKDSEPGDTAEVPPPSSIVSSSVSDYALITPSPFETRVRKIFIGPEGLRPVWRLALYLMVYRALYFGLSICLHSSFTDVGPLGRQLLARLGLALIAVVPALFIGKIEKRRLGSYGLPLRNAFGKLFWVGALSGLLSLSILLLALHGANVFTFGTLALHGVRMVKFAVFWGAFFLLVAIHEEFLTRGYNQFALTQAVGFWPSAILLSVGFGAIHLENPGESWVGILAAALIGFFFCLTLRRTGNLWFAIGFHASWDWGESYFYSVPDSGGMAPGHLLHSSFHGPNWLTGGSVGPEGSVFLFVLVALLWVVFDRVYPEVKYPATAKEISDSRL